jgi:SNF2 family DNA or RNA helicase
MDPRGRRIEVWFRSSPEARALIKAIPGYRFVSAPNSHNGVAHWTVPLDLPTARALREAFGEEMTMSKAIARWGREQVQQAKELGELSRSTTAQLVVLPEVLPDLYRAIHIGPRGRDMTEAERDRAMEDPSSFQAADVLFGAHSPNPLNANQMGLGKTIETIASIFEARLDHGPHLIIAPVSAMDATWQEELGLWQPYPVYIATGTKSQKSTTHKAFIDYIVRLSKPGWLVINPDQVRYREIITECERHVDNNMGKASERREVKDCDDCSIELVHEYPDLFGIEWNTITIDECHRDGIMNPKALTGKGARQLRVREGGKRFVLSGTPIGGKELNLFPILQYLNPKVFTSKWRWADRYLEVTNNGFGKDIGGLRRCSQHFAQPHRAPRGSCVRCDEMEDLFHEMLAPYMIRRTKAEVLPELPPKQRLTLWCGWAGQLHKQQYNTFADDAAVMIGTQEVTAANILTEYLRLGQFAFGFFTTRNGQLVPTEESGKLRALDVKLEELGIYDKGGSEQAVIFSHSILIVDLVYEWLRKKKVAVGKITGAVNKRGERQAIKSSFQGEGGLRVLVITTGAGGTSLTLDRASNVFILDETWKPDDQEQAEDRCHRASRIHQVTVWYLRTRKTIDEYKMDVNAQKALANRRVMDLARIRLAEEPF